MSIPRWAIWKWVASPLRLKDQWKDQVYIISIGGNIRGGEMSRGKCPYTCIDKWQYNVWKLLTFEQSSTHLKRLFIFRWHAARFEYNLQRQLRRVTTSFQMTTKNSTIYEWLTRHSLSWRKHIMVFADGHPFQYQPVPGTALSRIWYVYVYVYSSSDRLQIELYSTVQNEQ